MLASLATSAATAVLVAAVSEASTSVGATTLSCFTRSSGSLFSSSVAICLLLEWAPSHSAADHLVQ